MVLDIIIGVILVCTGIYGFRKGFVFTFIHTVGWIAAIVLAYLATPYVTGFAKKNTGIYNWFFGYFKTRFGDSNTAIDSSMNTLPASSNAFSKFSSDLLNSVSTTFATIAFTVVTFIILYIIIKLILMLFSRLLSKDYADGFRGFFDGFFGLVFGLIKGAVIVFLFLLVLVPLSNIVSPDLTVTITNQLDHSIVAQQLYSNNIILVLLQGFFS